MTSGHFYYGHEFPYANADVPSVAGYTSTKILAPYQGNAKIPQFHLAEAGFPGLRRRDTAPQISLPHDVLQQRAQTPCRHFEHHLGWCPYGMNSSMITLACHRAPNFSEGSVGPSTCPSLASSSASSPRGSPVPSAPYYLSSGVVENPYAYPTAAAAMSRIPHHGFVPRSVGGTTYFPIRLDAARLGYVTPTGVEVFTDL
ncbi:hypothetical protein EDB83DRAFT_2518744 [Lactarius deliciosus]|nr:hypothetical protein EDB83DRAFT_2518744 [Lactarius deliciosus]